MTKLNWNLNELKASEMVIDKELNKGLILTVGNILVEKKEKAPQGYSKYFKDNGLKNMTIGQVSDFLLSHNQFDFYQHFILSNDKFYLKNKDHNGRYTEKTNLEFVLCAYIVNDRQFIKGYYTIFNADMEQKAHTQTAFINEIKLDSKFIFNTDLIIPDFKGDLLNAYNKALDNFKDMKSLTTQERLNLIKENCKTLKEKELNDVLYISTQTQGIKTLKEKIEKDIQGHKENNN